MKLCQSCKDEAVARGHRTKNRTKGLVTGFCHLCDKPASGPRSYYCSDECRRVVRRMVVQRHRLKVQRARKEKVRDLLVLANRRINEMLASGRLEAETIRAIGRALSQVHVDGEDRWKTMAPRSEKKAA